MENHNVCVATVRVYLRTGGACFEYDIQAPNCPALTVKAREHLGKIQAEGYRHCADGVLEWFPPHWLDKVKITGHIQTTYPDMPSGT